MAGPFLRWTNGEPFNGLRHCILEFRPGMTHVQEMRTLLGYFLCLSRPVGWWSSYGLRAVLGCFLGLWIGQPLPIGMAAAQVDFFSFLRPPAPIPEPSRNRGTEWWPGWQPLPGQRGSSEGDALQLPKKRELPPEPEGIVYASADAAAQGKRQAPTQFALVIGDRMGSQLAQGLADVSFADRARIAIVAHTVEDSGFLPSPVDWLMKAPAAIAAGRPNVTIVALGTEDLKPIKEGDVLVAPLSDRWVEVYTRRLDDVFAFLRDKAGRVIVVGLAPVANANVSADFERLNEIVRARASRAGVSFVGVWDGFIDEDGKYLATGPAVDGQRRRLRLNDGVRFTRAGARKLAFFVQKDLKRLLDDPAKPMSPMEGGIRGMNLAGEPGKIGTSATPAIFPAKATAVQALREGVLPPSIGGRADDFTWPPLDGKASAADR